MKKVGLHIRLESTLTDVAQKALRLNVPIFQTFVSVGTGTYIKLKDKDIREFLKLRDNFGDLYLHASYWVNLCSAKAQSIGLLRKELNLARRLRFTHLILHPGAATGFQSRDAGIEKLAASLDTVLRTEKNIQIVLENTTHNRLSVGGDLYDFKYLLEVLKYKDRIKFCIDTAHAYGFGYDLATEVGQDKFIELIQETVGMKNVVLIHLNDTQEKLASKIDKHQVPGEGNIGEEALKSFVQKIGSHLPILLEMPPVEENIEKEFVDKVSSW